MPGQLTALRFTLLTGLTSIAGAGASGLVPSENVVAGFPENAARPSIRRKLG
jgi:hypothetical protein